MRSAVEMRHEDGGLIDPFKINEAFRHRGICQGRPQHLSHTTGALRPHRFHVWLFRSEENCKLLTALTKEAERCKCAHKG
jgi:hypothetical protein